MDHLPPLPGAKAALEKDFMPGDHLKIPNCFGDPMVFLEHVMDSPRVSLRARMQAASTLMQYKHPRIGEEGKKSKKLLDAQTATSGGRLAARKAPAARPVAH
jgi:hypothetical protein